MRWLQMHKKACALFWKSGSRSGAGEVRYNVLIAHMSPHTGFLSVIPLVFDGKLTSVIDSIIPLSGAQNVGCNLAFHDF